MKRIQKSLRKFLKIFLPVLELLVSGGNTILVVIHKNLEMEIVAETLDDAAGEAFDKGARLLGLPYPGGMVIEKFAISSDLYKYNFPRTFHDMPEMKFSFSGLKTSLRYFLEKENIDLAKDSVSDDSSHAYKKCIFGHFDEKSKAIHNICKFLKKFPRRFIITMLSDHNLAFTQMNLFMVSIIQDW